MSQTRRLSEALDAALDQPGSSSAEAGDYVVEIDAADVDRLGVVVERLRVNGPPGDVAERAARVAERLRPHGERLRAVEVDPGLGGAVLRTEPRDMRGGHYTEVELDREGASVTRHRKLPEGGRAREGFTMTREGLGRVVDDLADALRGEDEER